MNNLLTFQRDKKTYFLKIKYTPADRIWIFLKKLQKITAVVFLAGVGFYVLSVLLQRWDFFDKPVLFVQSFLFHNQTNFWFYLSLVLAVYAIYLGAYREENQAERQKNIWYQFDPELKEIFYQAACAEQGATPYQILTKALTYNKNKIALKLELPLKEFLSELEKTNSVKDSDASKRLWTRVLKYKKEESLNIYQVILAVITEFPHYKKLFFSHNVEEGDLFYYLSLLSEGKQLQKKQNHLFAQAQIRQNSPMNKALTGKKTDFLNSIGEDMTLQAKNTRYPYLVGRDHELNDLIRILKMSGTGALIVGKAGVGKSSMAQGLAYLMASEQVPEILQDKRLMSINVGLLNSALSGDKNGLIGLLEEVKASGNIVLVFDDLAQIVGTEKQSEGGAMDGFTILSNYISQYGLKVIGTITPKDHARYVQQGSGSSNRHFELLPINELERNDVLKILLLQGEKLSQSSGLPISVLAIKSVYDLAQRYISQPSFPAKGTQILQEALLYAQDQNLAVVTSQTIAELISRKTKIQVTNVTQAESQKLLALEQTMHERLIGQETAVKSVSAALRRARLDLHDSSKPIANFLFLGPTGVGKTELAKTLAVNYFGDENNMIRVDMSEYQDKKAVTKLIGDLGENGVLRGYLTEAVRQKPFSLVLLDELEKAHPDIFNIFLQVLDDGRLTDAGGDTIDFRNVILIATSNVGSLEIQKQFKQGKNPIEIRKNMMDGLLLEHFRPEFLNRFDDIVVFHPLAKEHIFRITDLLLIKLKAKLFAKRIHLQWTGNFVEKFSQKYFSFELGARPIHRAIQENIGNLVAEKMLSGELKRDQTLVLDDNGIKIK